MYSDVIVCPDFLPHLLGRHFNACNAIENKNRMRNSDLALDKCRVTHSDYFRLANIVALNVGIKDGNLLFCHEVSE